MTKKLINTRTSQQYPQLEIRKYNKRVFFGNLWDTDPQLLESRGHVYTTDGRRVVNTFTKIFNILDEQSRLVFIQEFLSSNTYNSLRG